MLMGHKPQNWQNVISPQLIKGPMQSQPKHSSCIWNSQNLFSILCEMQKAKNSQDNPKKEQIWSTHTIP